MDVARPGSITVALPIKLFVFEVAKDPVPAAQNVLAATQSIMFRTLVPEVPAANENAETPPDSIRLWTALTKAVPLATI